MTNMHDLSKSFFVITNLNAGGGRNTINDLLNLVHKFERAGFTVGYNKYIFTSGSGTPFWGDLDIQYEESLSYDGVIVLGGDGTKTYILNKLIGDKIIKPFVGISSGTMNVGYSSAFRIDDEIPMYLNEYSLDAVMSYCSNENDKVEYSFLESVIGNTFVTTYNGSITQVSAEKFLRTGDKIRTIPQAIGNNDTSICVKCKDGGKIVHLPSLTKIATLAVAPLTKELRARILAGGANPSVCIGMPGGLIITDFPLTWADVTISEILDSSPISSTFFPLQYEDEVFISGIDNGFLISDGNAVRKVDNISFKLTKSVYKLYK